jgi:hypothetical protein
MTMLGFLAPLAVAASACCAAADVVLDCRFEVECLGQDGCGAAPFTRQLVLDGRGNAVLVDELGALAGKEATAIGDGRIRVFFFAPPDEASGAWMLSFNTGGQAVLTHHGRYEGLASVTYFGTCGAA